MSVVVIIIITGVTLFTLGLSYTTSSTKGTRVGLGLVSGFLQALLFSQSLSMEASFGEGVAGSSPEGVQASGGIGEAPAQISGSASPQALRKGLAGLAPSGSAGKGHQLINGY